MTLKRKFELIGIVISILFFFLTPGSGGVFSKYQDDGELAKKAVAILETHCISCHGADKMAGLDLRTRDAMLTGGSRGPSIKPGNGEESLLYRFINGKEMPRMPLGGELSADDIESLKKWIDSGAPWPEGKVAVSTPKSRNPVESRFTEEQRDYWAFRKLLRQRPPEVRNKAWVKNPIDAFILARLEEKGLAPSPRADKRTLLRRVTYDLTGLPPTPEEIKEFINDRSPDAYRKVVRRLLASPRYGERWAQHWLDVVRFAETNGFELDADRDQAWRYRDYVIKSINEDKPYDRFILEQIAGDELEPRDADEAFELRVATGFLRAGPQHVVAGNQDLAVNRQEWLTEVMFGVGNGIMGLTVGCARCHDHKFDPVLQSDFYRLQAFFSPSDNYDFKRPTKAQQDTYDVALKAHQEKLKPIQDQIAAIEKPYRDRLRAEKRAKLDPHYAQVLAQDPKSRNEEEKRLAKEAESMLNISWDQLVAALSPGDKEKRAALRRQMHGIELYAPEPLPKALAVGDVINPVPKMHILKGGDPHRPGEVIEPGFLTVLLPPDSNRQPEIKPVTRPADDNFKSTGRRLALAKWLIDPGNPLTPRVIVNRLWHHHFGRGIVGTPNDFGRNGQQPTHPELLEWLAAELIARGWSLKAIHELMVLSSTYQQSSAIDNAKAGIDPQNRLLWRMNRQRLDAESIRDSVLAVSGALTEQTGGPPVRVPLEPEVYDTIFTEYEPDNLWPVHPDPRQHSRRSLYLLRKRNVRLPLLVAFDAPDMMSTCGARDVSVHALQALTLMNSEFIYQQSKRLAERLINESSGRERLMIDKLYQLALSRKPLLAELQLTRRFLNHQSHIIAGRLKRGDAVTDFEKLPPAIDRARAAAWVDLCLSLLNLNEFVYLK